MVHADYAFKHLGYEDKGRKGGEWRMCRIKAGFGGVPLRWGNGADLCENTALRR